MNQRTDNNNGQSVKIPMGNQKSKIKGQTTQWPKDKGQKDKQ
jgi:hypothetical protein